MRNIYKIVIIASIFILSIFILLLIVRPVLVRSGSHLARLAGEEERNNSLNAELDTYVKNRDKYYLLNAEYRKLAMELPDGDETLLLTNELYEIARYTEVNISNMVFTESKIDEAEITKTPVVEITIDVILEGSYYQILNFINTVEIMPRIMNLENVFMQAPSSDFNELLTYITVKTYFNNQYYR
ncbi:MAG: type 4a pilus biogenesis protein PilO [Actinomycetia bacterium]|nr:type 4a pilus biogenesis protein PilO [Actinomycetes bacterium]